jgi:hypothetical protein
MKREAQKHTLPALNETGEEWMELVRRQIGSLRFGVVQIVVHDSQVVQIEKTERVRLERSQRQDLLPTGTPEA